jgi:hypothetical protein
MLVDVAAPGGNFGVQIGDAVDNGHDGLGSYGRDEYPACLTCKPHSAHPKALLYSRPAFRLWA